MLEFANNPAFLPALYGFLAGAVLIMLISSIRGALARSAAHTTQKTATDKITALKLEKSALENEITTLRSSEARLIKHQGQLEGLAKSDEQREKQLSQIIRTTRESMQIELKAQEKTILEAISAIPVPLNTPPPLPIAPTSTEDLDFVPLENLPTSSDSHTAFEGFDVDEAPSKAESAANAFRAALKPGDS